MSSGQTLVPVPFVVAPTGEWDGDDGSWSTFAIDVGTPAQSFRVLPGTVGKEVWVPVPEGCESAAVAALPNCGNLRGINEVNGAPSQGFQLNKSSSWTLINILPLSTEQNLFPNTGALYGLDKISLGSIPSNTPGNSLQDQVVAGIDQVNFWLGVVGLGVLPSTFSGHATSFPSLLVSMKEKNLTTSLSYGYTAGKSYVTPKIQGSLVLGGYDKALIKQPTLSVPISSNASAQALQIGIHNIIATNLPGGSGESLLANPIVANIDSSVAQLWLPAEVCDGFAAAFGLQFDSAKELYTVNSTMRSKLQLASPSITFTLSSPSGSMTNVVIGYNAFDLEAGPPLYNFTQPYFPIRRAANATQYTIGRALLQEAYIIVDWERGNLTIGPVASQSSEQDIVPILSPSNPKTPDQPPHSSPSKGLTGGAIGGIVVGVLAVLAIAAGLWFFFRRRNRVAPEQLEQRDELEDTSPKTHGVAKPDVQQHEGGKSTNTHMEEVRTERHNGTWPFSMVPTPVYELEEPYTGRELMSSPIMELGGSPVGSELDVSRIPNRDPLVRENSGGIRSQADQSTND